MNRANSGALLTMLPVGSPYGGAAAVNGAVLAGDNFDKVLTCYTLNAGSNQAVQAEFAASRSEPKYLISRALP